MGRIIASFHLFGTVPEDSERLIKLVMRGDSKSVNCLSTRVGTGSSAHVLDSADAVRLRILNEDSSHMSSLLEHIGDVQLDKAAYTDSRLIVFIVSPSTNYDIFHDKELSMS